MICIKFEKNYYTPVELFILTRPERMSTLGDVDYPHTPINDSSGFDRTNRPTQRKVRRERQSTTKNDDNYVSGGGVR